MEVIILESEAFYTLLGEVIRRIKSEQVNQSNQNISTNEWLTLEQAQKILPYKSKTKWQELRDKGEVVFSQFGRKILYSKESLLDYIKRKKIKN
jgi:hypothetical protein